MTTPRGAIPRIERQKSHREFLWAVRPPAAMVNLTHAARIVMADNAFFPPETDTILTSTLSDSTLAKYTFVDELRIVREFNPDYYLPFDLPIYGDMNPDKRMNFVQQVKSGTEHMYMLMQSLTTTQREYFTDDVGLPPELVEPVQNTTIIPLIKGTTQAEREVMISLANNIGSPCIAKYGVQYMTVGGSGNYPQLKTTLNSIAEESDCYPLLVVGLLSPTGKYSLKKLPDNVVAGAGLNQWQKRVSFQTASTDEYRNEFASLYHSVSESLGIQDTYYTEIAANTPDTPPDEFDDNRGYTVTDELVPELSGIAGSGEFGFGQRKRPDYALGPVQAGKRSEKPSRET